MNTNMKMIAAVITLLTVSAFPLRAADAAKDQEKLQTRDELKTQDKLQDKDQVKDQDKLKLQDQDKLQLKDGTGDKATGLDRADEAAGDNGQQGRERAREMKGASNAKGKAVRQTERNAGEESAVKNSEKAGSGEQLKKQERKREKKAVQEKRQERKAERRSTRSGNRGNGRK